MFEHITNVYKNLVCDKETSTKTITKLFKLKYNFKISFDAHKFMLSK